MLKAYLITTGESPRSTPEFLAPVMLSSWERGQTIDADVLALARRQFEFYATLLAKSNPWPQAADARVVDHTRAFLNRFSGSEQIYQYMLAQAEKSTKPSKFAEAVPTAAGVIGGPAEVPGAFTSAGWTFMQGAFRNSDRFFEGEQWVVGDATASQTQDRDRILGELRARYASDYITKWRTFVKGLAVVRPAGARDAAVKDAAKKIGIIAGAQSPLLAALAFVARNTDVDSAVTMAFQPVHTVVPPNAKGKNVNEGNQAYVNGLVGLQGALEQVSYLPPVTDTASALALSTKGQEALGQVTQAKIAARQLEQKFAVDTSAVKIASAVGALLEAPIDGVEAVLKVVAGTRAPAGKPVVAAAPPPAPAPAPTGGGGGGGDKAKAAELAAILNERGRAICATMTPMLQKFPFAPDAPTEATVAEVQGLLAPQTGQIAAFQEERLGDLIEKQGGQWVAKPGGLVTLSAPFVAFFNKAMQVSAALFGGGAQPRVVFLTKAVTSPLTPKVTLIHGSQVAAFTSTTPENRFVWPAPSGREARLLAQFGKNKEREIAKATGEWAIFRLVAQSASATPGGGGALRAEWNATGKDAQPVTVEFNVESGAPVLQRGWLGSMSCASQVTR
jgi:type VI secretion system protein ImpL